MAKNKTFDLILSALGAALIAVCSWLIIPGAVPFSLQTFAVYCVLCLFGAKIGLQSILTYIIIGAVGVPVFSGFSSGIGWLFGTTGGYIIGFIFIGLIYALSAKLFPKKLRYSMISLVIGTVVCYAFGTGWYMIVYAKANGPIGVATALSWCVLPFVIPDMVKLFLAVFLSEKLKPIILKK